VFFAAALTVLALLVTLAGIELSACQAYGDGRRHAGRRSGGVHTVTWAAAAE
jgi:hypothetical protein